jgi:hypothetical protein
MDNLIKIYNMELIEEVRKTLEKSIVSNFEEYRRMYKLITGEEWHSMNPSYDRLGKIIENWYKEAIKK